MRPAALLAALAALTPATLAADPVSNAYMKYEDPKDWTVGYQVMLYPDTRAVRSRDDNGWTYSSFQIVAPIVNSCAFSWADTAEGHQPYVEFGWEGANTTLEAPRTLNVKGTTAPYFAVESATPFQFKRLYLVVKVPMTSYETTFDETAAWNLPWPAAYPGDAGAWLAHDPVYDVDDENAGDEVQALLDRWTGGNDPKKIPPVQLAKYLTASLLEAVRVVGPPAESPVSSPIDNRDLFDVRRDNNIYRIRTSENVTEHSMRSAPSLRGALGGLKVQNAAVTARLGTGSEHDLCNLLTAVLRRAGMPARTVIGVDKNENGLDKVKSWVEFAIVAPDVKDPIWVPIDLWELDGSGRNTRTWQQPWKNFGTSDLLRDVAPLAYHFHPPANYRSYSLPALFGVRADTALPDFGTQGVVFNIESTPKRGGQKPDPKRN